MGLQIGESVASLAALRQITPPPQGQEAANRTLASDPQQQNGANGRSNRRDQVDFLQAGFGANTVSVPGLALRTVDRNLASAREAVPTVEELRETLRERQQEVREAQRVASAQPTPTGEADEEEAAQQPVRFRPEASPRVRGFEQQEARIAQDAAAAPQDGVTPPGFSASERFDILA